MLLKIYDVAFLRTEFAFNYFGEKAPSEMFDRDLNVPLNNQFTQFSISLSNILALTLVQCCSQNLNYKISRSQMFLKTGVLKNFAILTGNHLCWNLFLIKLQPFRPSGGCFWN